MILYVENHKKNPFFRILCFFISFTFIFTMILPPTTAQAQLVSSIMETLPLPGTMVQVSNGFTPTLIKGIEIDPENPLRFEFIVDTGDTGIQGEELEEESLKLIKYFLASLTVPEEELWVNLSPYEGDRIVPENLGYTEMGRDLLGQDYILKQLTASMMFPEEELGKEFWKRVYAKAQHKFGTTQIPMNTFNKIWIVPHDATIYEIGATALVVDSQLKVMLEEDYVALQQNLGNESFGITNLDEAKVVSGVTAQVIKEVLIPEIEKEVNEGKNFAQLRQIYNAVILGTWFKIALKESLLGQVYVDQNKTLGIQIADREVKQKIYNRYLKAFRDGVYNFVKQDYDPITKRIIPRKYFSGGVVLDVRKTLSMPVRMQPIVANKLATEFRRSPSMSQEAMERTFVNVVQAETGVRPSTDLTRNVVSRIRELGNGADAGTVHGVVADFFGTNAVPNSSVSSFMAQATPTRRAITTGISPLRSSSLDIKRDTVTNLRQGANIVNFDFDVGRIESAANNLGVSAGTAMGDLVRIAAATPTGRVDDIADPVLRETAVRLGGQSAIPLARQALAVSVAPQLQQLNDPQSRQTFRPDTADVFRKAASQQGVASPEKVSPAFITDISAIGFEALDQRGASYSPVNLGKIQSYANDLGVSPQAIISAGTEIASRSTVNNLAPAMKDVYFAVGATSTGGRSMIPNAPTVAALVDHGANLNTGLSISPSSAIRSLYQSMPQSSVDSLSRELARQMPRRTTSTPRPRVFTPSASFGGLNTNDFVARQAYLDITAKNPGARTVFGAAEKLNISTPVAAKIIRDLGVDMVRTNPQNVGRTTPIANSVQRLRAQDLSDRTGISPDAILGTALELAHASAPLTPRFGATYVGSQSADSLVSDIANQTQQSPANVVRSLATAGQPLVQPDATGGLTTIDFTAVAPTQRVSLISPQSQPVIQQMSQQSGVPEGDLVFLAAETALAVREQGNTIASRITPDVPTSIARLNTSLEVGNRGIEDIRRNPVDGDSTKYVAATDAFKGFLAETKPAQLDNLSRAVTARDQLLGIQYAGEVTQGTPFEPIAINVGLTKPEANPYSVSADADLVIRSLDQQIVREAPEQVSIASLNISPQLTRSLMQNGVRTVGDLLQTPPKVSPAQGTQLKIALLDLSPNIQSPDFGGATTDAASLAFSSIQQSRPDLAAQVNQFAQRAGQTPDIFASTLSSISGPTQGLSPQKAMHVLRLPENQSQRQALQNLSRDTGVSETEILSLATQLPGPATRPPQTLPNRNVGLLLNMPESDAATLFDVAQNPTNFSATVDRISQARSTLPSNSSSYSPQMGNPRAVFNSLPPRSQTVVRAVVDAQSGREVADPSPAQFASAMNYIENTGGISTLLRTAEALPAAPRATLSKLTSNNPAQTASVLRSFADADAGTRIADLAFTSGVSAAEIAPLAAAVSRQTRDNRTSFTIPTTSATQTGDTQNVGGIDLNPNMLDLQIKRDENGIPLPVMQQPIGNMQIEGFLPVIIDIKPVNNLPMLLGEAGGGGISA